MACTVHKLSAHAWKFMLVHALKWARKTNHTGLSNYSSIYKQIALELLYRTAYNQEAPINAGAKLSAFAGSRYIAILSAVIGQYESHHGAITRTESQSTGKCKLLPLHSYPSRLNPDRPKAPNTLHGHTLS